MASCAACSHQNDDDTLYCQGCGAALAGSGDGEDLALSMMMGLVCEQCDSYNDPGSDACVVCGTSFGADGSASTTPPAALAPASFLNAPAGNPLATVNAMPAVSLSALSEEGRGLVEPAGSTPPQPAAVPPATADTSPAVAAQHPNTAEVPCPTCAQSVGAQDRFCRHCGSDIDAPKPAATMMLASPDAARAPAGPAATMMMPGLGALGGLTKSPSATQFFGAATVQRFARLTLVKGHTQFGTQWRLQAGETVVGRDTGVVIFPDDQHLGNPHFRIKFEGEQLFVIPEARTNGVFLGVKEPHTLLPQQEFVMGVQRFVGLDLEKSAPRVRTTDGSDALFLGSLASDQPYLSLGRIFDTPGLVEVYHRPQRILTFGRKRCDINFPTDPYMSTRHARVIQTPEGLVLEDLKSKNGTFVRITEPTAVPHGGAVMFGEQVLRIEIQTQLGGR